MVRVPTYENKVSPETPNIPNAVPIPRLDLSGGLSGIAKVGEANQGLAEAGAKIGQMLANHAQEQIKVQKEAANADLETSYRKNLQDIMLNDTPETVTINGQQVTRPSGVLQRQLGQAQGITKEFDKRGSDLMNRYLSQVKDPVYRQKLAASLGSFSVYQRDNVIKHEADQKNKNQLNIFESNIKKQIDDGAGAQTPDALSRAIDNITLMQDTLNKAKYLDPQTSDVNVGSAVSKLVNNAVTNSLMTSGNLTTAQALLDSVKQKIGVDSYNEIGKKLGIGFQRMKSIVQQQALEARTVDRYNYLTDVLNGKIDWSNADKVISEVGPKDPALAEAINRIVRTGGQFVPTSNNPMNDLAYMNTVKTMISMNDKQQVSDFLLKTLTGENGGKISLDKLSMLVSAAKQRHEELSHPVQQKSNGMMKSAIDFFEKSNVRLAPAMFMNFIHSVFNGGKGKTFEQLKQEAARKAIVQEHPEVGGLQSIPNKISNPNQTVNSIYNGTELLQGIDDSTADSSQNSPD